MSKLHRSIYDGRLLCSYCYKTENQTRLKKQITTINDLPLHDPMQKQMTPFKSSNLAKTSYFTKDERNFFKSRYGNEYKIKFNELRHYTQNNTKKNLNKVIPKTNNKNSEMLKGLGLK